MPMQHGFKFTIKGDVFVARKSSDGGDVIAALEEADDIRAKIQKMLLELPVVFTCTMPKAASRQAPAPPDKPANKAFGPAPSVAETEEDKPPADGE